MVKAHVQIREVIKRQVVCLMSRSTGKVEQGCSVQREVPLWFEMKKGQVTRRGACLGSLRIRHIIAEIMTQGLDPNPDFSVFFENEQLTLSQDTLGKIHIRIIPESSTHVTLEKCSNILDCTFSHEVCFIPLLPSSHSSRNEQTQRCCQ